MAKVYHLTRRPAYREGCEAYGARLHHLQRRFEAAGFSLHRLSDHKLIVSRWELWGVLTSLDDAERFLRRALQDMASRSAR